jgi:hypothetical protein
MAGHPSDCGAVGVPNASSNHPATAGKNIDKDDVLLTLWVFSTLEETESITSFPSSGYPHSIANPQKNKDYRSVAKKISDGIIEYWYNGMKEVECSVK